MIASVDDDERSMIAACLRRRGLRAGSADAMLLWCLASGLRTAMAAPVGALDTATAEEIVARLERWLASDILHAEG